MFVTIPIGGLIVAILFAVILIPLWIRRGVENFKRWRATGYCRHSWKLHSTHSFGNYADYKCEKCNEIRSMRM